MDGFCYIFIFISLFSSNAMMQMLALLASSRGKLRYMVIPFSKISEVTVRGVVSDP